MTAPTLAEACERLAVIAAEIPDREWDICPVDRDVVASIVMRRADLVALLAAVGWNVTVDEARDTPAPAEQPMFGGHT